MLLHVFIVFICSLLLVSAGASKQAVADFVKQEREAGRIPVLKKELVGNFFDADLTGLDLRYVDFRGLDFLRANLSKTRLEGANFTGVDLGGVIFDGADLCGSIGFGDTPTYGRVLVVGADFSGMDLSDKDFKNYDFTRAKLHGCNVSGSRFIGHDLLLEQFKDAMVKNMIILNHPSESFRKTMSYRGAVTDRKILEHRLKRGVSYKHVSFHSFDFIGARLEKVDFTGYMLNHAKFNNANLQGAVFDDAEVVGTRWIGAKLKGASFVKASCDSGDFSDADIDDVDFSEASIEDTNFTKATGSPKQEMEALRDESDFQWNRFWRGMSNFFCALFPLLYFIALPSAVGMSVIVFKQERKVDWIRFVILLSFGTQVLSILLMFTGYSGSFAACFFCMMAIGIILFTSLLNLIIGAVKRFKLNWINVFCVISHCIILLGIPYLVISLVASV